MKITVNNEIGREVNPNPYYRHEPGEPMMPTKKHLEFEQSIQSYPAPNIPNTKDGEFVESELVWQYRTNNDLVKVGIHKELTWKDCLHEKVQQQI